jgi:8-oxo-dGTP pyrophosphatase MutT (NUDIX family)
VALVIKMSVNRDLPKPRDQMTEADWRAYRKTWYTTWYTCAGVIVKYNNKILLVQDKISKKWSFPKGAPEVADKDDPINTAIRECYEETALIHGDDYTFTTLSPVKFPYDNYYMIATIQPGAEARARVNDDEGLQVKWCTRADLSLMWKELNSGIRHYAKNY